MELVSIAASDGSTPRGAGAMMAVFPGGGITGTIGGGNVEFECQRLAAELLERGGDALRQFRFTLGDAASLGMVCGGGVTVQFQYLPAGEQRIIAVLRDLIEADGGNRDTWLLRRIEGEQVTAMGLADRTGPRHLDILPEELELLCGNQAVFARKWLSIPVVKAGRTYLFGGGHVSQALVPVLASVGFDALSHNMEGYLATRSQPITDQLALHAIRLTAGSLPKVYHGEGTQEDWENITLASLLGGIVINTAGVGGGHGMEHPVSGMYNVVHGKGLAALTPPLFRHSYNTKPERYAAISRLLGGKDETDCAEAVERFLKSIDLNCKLRELGVEEYGIDWMTDNCINVFAGSMRNHTKALTRDEVKQIYLEAF